MILETYTSADMFRLIPIMGAFERKKHSIIEQNDFSYLQWNPTDVDRPRIPGHFYISDKMIDDMRAIPISKVAKKNYIADLESIRKVPQSWVFCKDMCLYDVDEFLKKNPEHDLLSLTREMIRKHRYAYPPIQILRFLYAWFSCFPNGYYVQQKTEYGASSKTVHRVDPRTSSGVE